MLLLKRLLVLAAMFASFLAVLPARADPPPLEAYGDLEAVEDLAISPNGQRLAFIARVQGTRRLMVTAGDRILLNELIGESKMRSVNWIGDEMIYAVISTTYKLGMEFVQDKTELFGALVFSFDGKKPRYVFGNTPSMANVIRGTFGTRLIDGKRYGYFGGMEYRRGPDGTGYYFDHGRRALFEVDLESNKPHKLANAANEGRNRDWLIDGDGKVAVTFEVQDDGNWQILSSEGKAIATGRDPDGDIALVSLGKDGSSVIYSRDDDAAGKTRWFEVPLAGGTPVEILADVGIERIYVDSTNGRLLGYLQEGETPLPVLFDPVRQREFRSVLRAFPKLNATIADWTPNFSHFVVHTSGNGDSGSYWIVDIAAKKADTVGYERPRVQPDQVGNVSSFDYKASDGLDLDGVLTLPPGREAKNLPVIIFPHGGPQSHDIVAFDWWAQAFASRGYAVVQPNFRGSTNRDLAFRQAGYGQWGRKMQTDLTDALAELAKRGIVDPKRACIMGGSYGGYAALAGVTLQNGFFRCAVAVAPVSDLFEFYATDYRNSGDSKVMRNALRESLGQPSTFEEVSPRKNAGKADAPILLIHGTNDTRVPFRHSQIMANALKAAGKPHELVVLQDEDHFLSLAATRKQMLEAAMRFVQQHNPAN